MNCIAPNLYRQLFVLTLFLIASLLLSPTSPAQDARGDRSTASPGLTAATGPRTSPFDPPLEDTFVADAGPGLDTGCTFNDDPGHPLIFDILIDRAVGPVDGNGFLIDPDALIARGVIPSSVQIIMPAFDVDFNGPSPPERDEVLLNGINLGLLTGDNQIWKLNTFTVDIRDLKFPMPPAPGSAITPRANRVQINVDLLSSGRWCTAIDWAALVVPIQSEVALTLEPIVGNKIRVNNPASNDTIDVIYQQSADADCNLTQNIGPIDEFPFSGPSESGFFGLFAGEAKVRAKLEPCPAGSLTAPEVEARWSIAGTSLEGAETWTGLEGNITVTMPEQVGSYIVTFEFNVDGEALDPVSRKLFVTKRTPLGQVNPPRRHWYELATDWASGQSDESDILEHLLDGLYSYGQANWRYGYCFDGVLDPATFNCIGAPLTCTWQQLAADPLTCNYAECHDFSPVFENMAATLGIGGMTETIPRGSQNRGFVTRANHPSLDPAFPGSARPLAGGPFDRYSFANHNLRRRSSGFLGLSTRYYDATFNGIYSSSTEFIDWNYTGANGIDADGLFLVTVEGANLYLQGGLGYGNWTAFAYKPPAAAPNVLPESTAVIAATTENLAFTGTLAFRTPENNGDGLFEALIADVEVQVLSAGEYTIYGILTRNGDLVANTPIYRSSLFTHATVNGQPGVYTASLQFSGEQIRQSGLDGPYMLELAAVGQNTSPVTATLSTPPYSYAAFGELGSRLISVSDSTVDTDGDGRFDFVEVDVQVNVAEPGTYIVQGTLLKDGVTLVNASQSQALASGIQTVPLHFPGVPIFRSGQDGPYDGTITLLDANAQVQGSLDFQTQAYSAAQFEGLLDVLGGFNDQGIDSNANGLFDELQVSFTADVRASGAFLVTGVLQNALGTKAVYTETLMNLAPGQQILVLSFSGPEIRSLAIDGPYSVELVLSDPGSFEVLDRVSLGQETAPYSHTEFDPLGVPSAIVLTGTFSDQGLDDNGNGLFDRLQVSIEVELAGTDNYQWSARLLDINGQEIGFDSRGAFLSGGRQTINLFFDGNAIGQNGIAGPYSVRNLLVFGQLGANLVRTEVTDTQSYAASQFEGFQAQQGDLDGDGDVDRDDLNIVLAARNTPASGPGDPRDLDGDGMITALDARQLRLLCTRPFCANQ